MAASYLPAPEVAAIASDLIVEHHPELAKAPIVYVFREGVIWSKGRLVGGRARLVGGLHAYIANLAGGSLRGHPEFGHTFFVMEIGADTWEDLTESQRAALVDHELCHMAIAVDPEDDTCSLEIVGHDVEEFLAVARRHGAWSSDLAQLASIVCGSP